MKKNRSGTKAVTIQVVSDQDRLLRLFSFVGQYPGIILRVACDLDAVSVEEGGGPPDLLFIQGRMAGLSGEILVNYIRQEFGGEDTAIVLFVDPADLRGGGGEASCRTLDGSLPDDQLAHAVKSIVARFVPEMARRYPAEEPKPGPRPGTRARPVGYGEGDGTPAVPPVRNGWDAGGAGYGGPVRGTARSGDLPAGRTANAPEEVADMVRIRGREPLAGDGPRRTGANFLAELEGVMAKAAPRSGRVEAPPRGRDDYPPRPAATAARRKSSSRVGGPRVPRGFRFGIITILALVAGAILLETAFLGNGTEPEKGVTTAPQAERKKETAPPSPPAKRELTELPSFIPRDTLDGAYGRENPGWERYRSAAAEFKVFRERNVIRALQVIDRSGKGIGPELFTTVLREVAGAPDYVVESQDRKGDFSVEKGELSIHAKIVIYRKNPAMQVRAFVIDFR